MKFPRRTNLSRQSKSFAGKRRRKVCVLSVVSILCVAIVLFVASKVCALSLFKITDVKIFGATEGISATMKESAQKSLQDAYFNLFSRSNTLIYPHDTIIQTIKLMDPRIDSVVITRDGFHGLIISVNQKIPVAVICANLPDWNESTFTVNNSDTCYVSDTTGFIFDHAPASSGHVYARYFMPDRTATSTSDLVGTYVAPARFFSELQKFYSSISDAGIVVEGLLVQGDGSYELYIDNQNSNDVIVVHFNTSVSLTDVHDNLIAFWSHMVSAARTSKKPLHLSDIQLQFPPNVYFTEVK